MEAEAAASRGMMKKRENVRNVIYLLIIQSEKFLHTLSFSPTHSLSFLLLSFFPPFIIFDVVLLFFGVIEYDNLTYIFFAPHLLIQCSVQ